MKYIVTCSCGNDSIALIQYMQENHKGDFIVLYNEFDHSTEILMVQIGRAVFRGQLQNFHFELDAERPWNWKYGATFVAQQGLSTYAGDNENLLNDKIDTVYLDAPEFVTKKTNPSFSEPIGARSEPGYLDGLRTRSNQIVDFLDP